MLSSILTNLVQRHPDLEICLLDIQRAYDLLIQTFHMGGKLLVCGNGGSASDSDHIVAELMKGFLLKRPLPRPVQERLSASIPEGGAYLAQHLQGALPVISLSSQAALATAFANDVAPDLVFAQQVYGYGQEGDALIAISTSGRSQNILYALQLARLLGLRTIGLTGQDGGFMKKLCQATICVPETSTPCIQEGHEAIYHAICAMLEQEFFV